jgi:cell division septum initiation protein DivIVA
MRYTPVELRHVRLGRALFGYKRDEADKVLEEVADSFEEVWRDRGELADKLEDLEKLLADVKQRETLLATTLVSAEKAAADAKESAKREAELIIAEAHQEARSIVRTAHNERERLFTEARRVEVLLRSALGMVEEAHVEASTQGEPESPAPTPLHSWPRREDTREFQAIEPSLPPPLDEHPGPADDGGDWTARDFAWG